MEVGKKPYNRLKGSFRLSNVLALYIRNSLDNYFQPVTNLMNQIIIFRALR